MFWKKYKLMISNFSYLSALELFGLIFPLITYPYLIRVVGKELYGVVVFAQSIMAYMVIIVNFGFNVSATKDISEYRNDPKRLSQITSTIFTLKTGLFLLLAIPYLLVIFFLNVTEYKLVYLFSLGLCIQEIYFPTWFFQGIEQMKYITIVSFITRFFFLFLIFLLIRKSNDYIYIPLINSLGGILSSIVSFYILKFRFGIDVIKVDWNILKTTFKDSIPFFYSRFINTVMDKSNAVFIGTFLGYGDVACYDLGMKIVSILRIPFTLISQVLYPSIVISKDTGIIKQMLKLVLAIGFLIIVIIWIMAPFIVDLLGGTSLHEAVYLLYILVLVLPGVGMSYVLGASTLVTFGYIKEYNMSVVYGFVIYTFIILIMLWPLKISLWGVALAYILPEYAVSFYRLKVAHKYKIVS